MQALLDVTNPAIEGHIRGLSALGKPEDSYGALLILIIPGKLPTDIQRNLAREYGSLEWILNNLKQGILKKSEY